MSPPPFPVVEYRRYRTVPGRREALVELFERAFLESQEAAGAWVIGQFRDIDRPDTFNWLRGFTSMEARREASTAFYCGPVWQAHREAANATMEDSDDVYLLQPWGHALTAPGTRAAPEAAGGRGRGLLAAVTCPLSGDEAGFAALFDRAAAEARIETLARFVGLHEENTFPRLPVRTGEPVFVWLASVGDRDGWSRLNEALKAAAAWREASALLSAAPEVRLLEPTARSRLQT